MRPDDIGHIRFNEFLIREGILMVRLGLAVHDHHQSHPRQDRSPPVTKRPLDDQQIAPGHPHDAPPDMAVALGQPSQPLLKSEATSHENSPACSSSAST